MIWASKTITRRYRSCDCKSHIAKPGTFGDTMNITTFAKLAGVPVEQVREVSADEVRELYAGKVDATVLEVATQDPALYWRVGQTCWLDDPEFGDVAAIDDLRYDELGLHSVHWRETMATEISAAYRASIKAAVTATMTTTKITKHAVDENDYDEHTYKLFGDHYSMSLAPHVFGTASRLSAEYGGGTWDFFALSNGGFFMSPRSGTSFNVSRAYGAPVKMSAEGLGITACLFALSDLSFGRGAFAETCGWHYRLLRAFAYEHLEAPAIYRAID